MADVRKSALIVRHVDVSIPRDGVAHIHETLADAALEMMERNMSAEITSCADVPLSPAEA